MATSQVGTDFLQLLEKSSLLTPDTFSSVVSEFGLREVENAKEIAEKLISTGQLTKFQADRLLAGRYRGFFIGEYKVLELLGCGGMGWLYIAEHRKNGQRFALKVLSEKHEHDPGMLARFRLEANAGARLNHPNIVRTYQVQQTGHVSYVVMEFVEGINLHELNVLKGPRSWAQACDMICQGAEGLQHAHDLGLVHRDIKPSNLVVDHAGGTKILDFGLALMDGDENDDEFSLAMIFGHDCLGTADYMAPEQARNSFDVDPRADVYSLGAMFYYLLTGSVPFPADTSSQKLAAHVERPRPDPRQTIDGIPPEVVDILHHMLAVKREDRITTATGVREALEPFAVRKPVDFDFEHLLLLRAQDTKRRLKRVRQAAESSKSAEDDRHEMGSTMSGVSAPQKKKNTPQQKVETSVGGDTRAGKSEVSLDAPFSTTSSEESFEAAPPKSMSIATEHFEILVPVLTLKPLDGGKPIQIDKPTAILGRDPTCDVRLSFGFVSGKHCEFRFDGDRWEVIDNNSRNGVQINGVRTKRWVLQTGDELTISQRLQYEAHVEGDAAPGSNRKLQYGIAAVMAMLTAIVLWLVFGP